MLKKIIVVFVLIFSIFSLDYTYAESCTESTCINSENFEINVTNITPTSNESGIIVNWKTEETLNNFLGTTIQQLMIRLGAISLIIMTIGWWYMIIYHGQDELLSKWKYIFMSWVIALVVALGSYYIVSLLRYVLYKN